MTGNVDSLTHLNKLIESDHTRDFFKVFGDDPVWKLVEKNENGRAVKIFNQLSGHIWKSNTNNQDNIIRVAAMLFISRDDNPLTQAQKTTSNLLKLFKGMESDTQDNVEEILFSMTQFMPPHVFDFMWHEFISARENRKLALISMMATLAISARQHIQPLVCHFQKVLADPRVSIDVKVETVRAIANLGTQRNNIVGDVVRLPIENPLFFTLERLLITEYMNPEKTTYFFQLARNVLLIFFNLSNDTSTLVANLIRKILRLTKDDCEQSLTFGRSLRGKRRREIRIKNRSFYYNNLNVVHAERILGIIGEIALRLDVFTEMCKPNIKRRFPMFTSQYLSKELNSPGNAKVNITELEYRYVRRIGELPLMVARDSEELDNMRFFEYKRRLEHREKIEFEIIVPHFLPFVKGIMQTDNITTVKVASYIAISKLMLLGRELAYDLAPLYFSILQSEHQTSRKNFLISIADVCFRVPEIVRSHASEIYAMVLDKDMSTKVTCIVVVSHLVRFSRLDVTEEATEFAKCLLHENELIRSITGSFFANIEKLCMEPLVPMILGRLAMKHFNMEKYRQLLAVLFNYVSKGKSSEILKHMFDEFELLKGIAKTVKNEKVPEYLSLCISQLYLSKNAMRELRAKIHTYRPFLKSKRFLYHIILALQRLIKTTHKTELADEAKALQRDLRAIHKQIVNNTDNSDSYDESFIIEFNLKMNTICLEADSNDNTDISRPTPLPACQ
ncbi:unnamed protein product [Auanema sp. JU1783]|nr:unnamed protein product [Auanema sp. JU1783]